ncbi:MAG: cytochrome PufQ [Gemmobacter sp.]
MTDYSFDIPKGRARRTGPVEYTIYFAPIFVMALPFSLAVWASYPLRKGRLPSEGPLARALRDARGITAQIIRGV